MASSFRSLRLFAGACVLATVTSCSSGPVATTPSSRQVAETFVEEVVLPNYSQLAEETAELARLLKELASNPSEQALADARGAWRTARQSWETSESWAFGPAETGGYDGNLDDWPVNEKDLSQAVLTPGLTREQFSRLTTTARGFHGIEAVLFGFDGQPPKAEQLTVSQLSYLREAGVDMETNAGALLKAWQGPDGFGSSLRNESNPNNAVAEIVQGMIGTLEEVADEKLGKPLASRDKGDLESFYSDTTQADVVANLKGVQKALSTSKLLELIQASDADLGRSIEQAVAESVNAATALPPQLNGALVDSKGRSAMEQVISQSQRSASLLKQALEKLS